MAVYYQATVVNSAGTSGAQAWVPLDIHAKPFDTSFMVRRIGTGSGNYRIEHTFDNVLADASTKNILTHEDVSAQSSDADGNYAFPVRAIRLFTLAASGQSTFQFTVIQGGP